MTPRFLPGRGRRAAFTLIEIVISSSLVALIVVSAYLCFSASVAGQKQMEPRLEVVQNARVAMALMAADLRAACPLDKDAEFIGMQRTIGEAPADNLDFATHNYTPQRAGEGDFCEESFYLQPNPETGGLSLWRRRNPVIALDPLSGGRKEEIATGVRGLRFEYYDGLDWFVTWGDAEGLGKTKARNSQRTRSNQSGMPEAVRITLWFDPGPAKKNSENNGARDEQPEPALVFQTVARLNLAAAQNNAAGADATTTDTTGQTGAEGGGY